MWMKNNLSFFFKDIVFTFPFTYNVTAPLLPTYFFLFSMQCFAAINHSEHYILWWWRADPSPSVLVCCTCCISLYIRDIHSANSSGSGLGKKKCHVKDDAVFLCKLKKGNILFSWGVFPLGVPGKYRYCWQELHRKHSSHLALSVVVFPLRGGTSRRHCKSPSPNNHCATVLTVVLPGLAARSKKQIKVTHPRAGILDPLKVPVMVPSVRRSISRVPGVKTHLLSSLKCPCVTLSKAKCGAASQNPWS